MRLRERPLRRGGDLRGAAEQAVSIERRPAGPAGPVTTDCGTMQSKLAAQVPFWVGAPPASSCIRPPGPQFGNR